MAPVALVGLMAIGTTLQVAGQLRQASAQADADAYQAKQAETLANRADQNALITRDQTAIRVYNEHREDQLALGSIRAGYGASGVTSDGTAKDYEEEQASIAKAKEMNTKYQGVLQAKAYEDQAMNYRSQGAQFRIGAGNALSAGYLNAAASGVGGITSIAKATGVGFSRSSTLGSD